MHADSTWIRACLVVEDAVSGVQAARAAGACCPGLTDSFSAEKPIATAADVPAARREDASLERFLFECVA